MFKFTKATILGKAMVTLTLSAAMGVSYLLYDTFHSSKQYNGLQDEVIKVMDKNSDGVLCVDEVINAYELIDMDPKTALLTLDAKERDVYFFSTFMVSDHPDSVKQLFFSSTYRPLIDGERTEYLCSLADQDGDGLDMDDVHQVFKEIFETNPIETPFSLRQQYCSKCWWAPSEKVPIKEMKKYLKLSNSD